MLEAQEELPKAKEGHLPLVAVPMLELKKQMRGCLYPLLRLCRIFWHLSLLEMASRLTLVVQEL